jgi:hypothetical protein
MTVLATTASPAAEVTIEGTATVLPVADANAAASSTAETEGAKEDQSLLSVMRSAIEKPADPVASPASEEDPAVAAVTEEAPAAEASADDDKNLPFHEHPRWQAVLAERDALKAPAEQHGHIMAFMQEHGLTPEEVTEGYEVMAMLKSSDPDTLGKAREYFVKNLQALDGMLGFTLPEDLQERVESGFLDEEGARELATARAAKSLRDSRAEALAADEAAASKDREVRDAAQAITASVASWEDRIKTADPDYAKKAKLIEDRALRIMQSEGPARNPAEAVALVERAHKEITAEFRAVLPKPRSILPNPPSVNTTATAAPASMKEAMIQALGR